MFLLCSVCPIKIPNHFLRIHLVKVLNLRSLAIMEILTVIARKSLQTGRAAFLYQQLHKKKHAGAATLLQKNLLMILYRQYHLEPPHAGAATLLLKNLVVILYQQYHIEPPHAGAAVLLQKNLLVLLVVIKTIINFKTFSIQNEQ